MTDLRDQLRDYFDEIDPPFDTTSLMREPRPGLAPTRNRVGRGVLIAVTAGVLLLLVVGLPLLLSSSQSDRAIEPSVTTIPSVTTTVRTAPTTTTMVDAHRPIIEVVFDGENCSVTAGPTSVPARAGQAFVLTDNSGIGARLHVGRIMRDDLPYDALVRLNEIPGGPSIMSRYFVFSEYFSFAPEHYPAIDLADNQSLSVLLLTDGPYAMYVESTTLNRIWLCAPLEVTAVEF